MAVGGPSASASPSNVVGAHYPPTHLPTYPTPPSHTPPPPQPPEHNPMSCCCACMHPMKQHQSFCTFTIDEPLGSVSCTPSNTILQFWCFHDPGSWAAYAGWLLLTNQGGNRARLLRVGTGIICGLQVFAAKHTSLPPNIQCTLTRQIPLHKGIPCDTHIPPHMCIAKHNSGPCYTDSTLCQAIPCNEKVPGDTAVTGDIHIA